MGKIEIKKISITKLEVDAIVNAANDRLMAGGGVCGAIFREAGYQKLSEACSIIGGCKTGQAVITEGFDLPTRYVIHAVGPIWNGGRNGESDFVSSNPDYDMNIIFAVLDDNIMRVGQRILERI